MERVMIAMKLTEAERALLRRRAEKEKLTEADYLRVCMLMDSLYSGDVGALGVFAEKVRERVREKFALALEGFKDAPVKARG